MEAAPPRLCGLSLICKIFTESWQENSGFGQIVTEFQGHIRTNVGYLIGNYQQVRILVPKTLHFMSVNCFNVLYNTSFKEHLPEDGHNRWPKHVAGYSEHNIINQHISVCTCWLFLIRNHLCTVIDHFKLRGMFCIALYFTECCAK
jgi:hypothetical protein